MSDTKKLAGLEHAEKELLRWIAEQRGAEAARVTDLERRLAEAKAAKARAEREVGRLESGIAIMSLVNNQERQLRAVERAAREDAEKWADSAEARAVAAEADGAAMLTVLRRGNENILTAGLICPACCRRPHADHCDLTGALEDPHPGARLLEAVRGARSLISRLDTYQQAVIGAALISNPEDPSWPEHARKSRDDYWREAERIVAELRAAIGEGGR